MNYTSFTVYPAYADYTNNRFGKTLILRKGGHGNPEIARVTFAKGEKVTYGVLRKAIAEHGFKLAGDWKPGTGVMHAALHRA